MADEKCNIRPCRTVLPFSTVVGGFGSNEISDVVDCSTTLIYLTDDAGYRSTSNFFATDDDTPLLTVDKRTQVITSLSQLEFFYTKCSRTWFEISRIFDVQAAELVRPQSVTLLFYDRENDETMIKALTNYYTCNRCFYAVTHVAYNTDGVALFDNAAIQLPLSEWGTMTKTLVFLPTADKPNLTSLGDTASVAFQAKESGHTYGIFVFLNDECPYIRDENCEPTTEIVTVAGAQHLLAAGIVTSKSTTAANIAFNFKFKPLGGVAFPNISTAQLSIEETATITGANQDGQAGLSPSSTHYVNVYHNMGGMYHVFLEGVNATGVPIDKLVYSRYIYDNLSKKVFELMVSSPTVAASELSSLTNTLASEIRRYVEQGIVSNTTGIMDKKRFKKEQIVLEGEGWVLLQTTPMQGKRVTPNFLFCYVDNESVDFVSLALCKNNTF